MRIRNGLNTDYDKVISVMNEWWGGRQVDHLQHELFFDYFTDTIFIAEDEDKRMLGFINGFYSQKDAITAYVHFIGVSPSERGSGIGKNLYLKFFEKCIADGRYIIRSCTSKVNQASVDFHLSLGFEPQEDARGKVQFNKSLR